MGADPTPLKETEMRRRALFGRQDPAFAAVLGIHIDYIGRGADGTHTDIVDAIDFRKGPAGSFEHHTT